MENLQLNRYNMKLKFAVLFTVVFSFVCCNTNNKNSKDLEDSLSELDAAEFEFATWITSNPKKTNASYAVEFKKYKDNGIDEVLINTLTDPNELARLVPIAKGAGLNVHAWIMTMNRPGDTTALKHPE